MGSTLAVLRGYVEDWIDSGVTDSSTDPTSATLNNFLNLAIRKVTKRTKPRELISSTVSTANISAGQNTATIPTGLFFPTLVYVADQNGKFRECQAKSLKNLISDENPTQFFDFSNVGVPTFFDLLGANFVFNKYFDYSATGGVKCYGLSTPTTLSADSDATELPSDYDLVITYEAAAFYYQKDDDADNNNKYLGLAANQYAEISTSLDFNDQEVIAMDPHVFVPNSVSFSDPSVFFGAQ